ncbi:MAG: hypothetical protein ACO3A4_14320 [Silvanigrellaceae bacterium]
MLIMNSPDDKFIPWQGGAMKRGVGGTLLSVDATIDFWKNWNRCTETKQEVRPKAVPTDKTNVTVTRHTRCQGNASVVLQKIEGGGHTWPGGEAQPAWLVGVTSQEVNATQETWNFFEKQSLQ